MQASLLLLKIIVMNPAAAHVERPRRKGAPIPVIPPKARPKRVGYRDDVAFLAQLRAVAELEGRTSTDVLRYLLRWGRSEFHRNPDIIPIEDTEEFPYVDDPAFLEELTAIATARGRVRSDVMRLLAREGLKQHLRERGISDLQAALEAHRKKLKKR